MIEPARILLISGSLRARSSNGAVVETAASLDLPEIETALYDGIPRLPHFNPDDDFDPLPATVIELRAQIERANGLMFCTPEYAGALPGSFKNLLDWTIGGPEMHEKPVAWINCAQPGRGLNAIDSLKKVLGYASTTIVEEACIELPVPPDAIGKNGLISDVGIRDGIGGAVIALAKRSARPSGLRDGRSASAD